jgi:hypothetical protein
MAHALRVIKTISYNMHNYQFSNRVFDSAQVDHDGKRYYQELAAKRVFGNSLHQQAVYHIDQSQNHSGFDAIIIGQRQLPVSIQRNNNTENSFNGLAVIIPLATLLGCREQAPLLEFV